MYGQRIGCFSLIAADQKEAQAAESQVKVCRILLPVWPSCSSCAACLLQMLLSAAFSGHDLQLPDPKHQYAQSVTALPCCSADSLQCRLQKIARAIYSNPPLHGALLVSTILNDEKLKQQWYKASAVAACSRQRKLQEQQ